MRHVRRRCQRCRARCVLVINAFVVCERRFAFALLLVVVLLHGTARHGTARHGTARHGTVWRGSEYKRLLIGAEERAKELAEYAQALEYQVISAIAASSKSGKQQQQ